MNFEHWLLESSKGDLASEQRNHTRREELPAVNPAEDLCITSIEPYLFIYFIIYSILLIIITMMLHITSIPFAKIFGYSTVDLRIRCRFLGRIFFNELIVFTTGLGHT